MFFWSSFPFVRITIAFALGIISSVFLPGYQFAIALALFFLVLFLLTSSFFNKIWFLKINWLFGFVIVLISFSLGYARLFMAQTDSQDVKKVGKYKILAYQARVLDQPIKKGKYFKSTVQISLVKDSIWHSISYKINLYIKAGSAPFQYGDNILVAGAPQPIKEPQNPDEFNYKRYLTFLTVYQQHFTDSAKVNVLSSNNGNPIMAASIKQRAKFSKLLETYIAQPQELNIAKALLLGNKNGLDDETKNTYAASGAMHVLAVSGLHVGIIYGIIFWLFSRLPSHYQKKWLIAAIAIPLLWGYAFITGLSPSVLRAVTLFSIIALGNSINRRTNIVNLLAVSAFILLMYKPYLLMQVGFQLSYIAVLGIIFIYPQIRKLWMPSSRTGIFFWDVTSISIAAQLATFPLSILYFHRFPPYFIVSNLVVIPAATLIVWLGIAFFILSFVNLFATILGAALAYIIGFINNVLAVIYQLPSSDLNNIYLNVPQTWLLYLVIIFLFLFVVYKNIFWAKMASISMVMLTIFIGYSWIKNNQLKQITVYNIPYHFSLDLIQSGESVSIMDSLLMEKPDKIHFHINPNRMLNGVNTYADTANYAWQQLPYGKALVWNNTSILMLDRNAKAEEFPFDIVLSKSNQYKVGINTKKFDYKNEGSLLVKLE